MKISDLRRDVVADAARIADLGEWPNYISLDSLPSRVPVTDELGNTVTEGAGGFDAGIACALRLIPLDKQRLAARLHAAYTPEAVAQVRREAEDLNPDSETTWWLAACSICEEGPSDATAFAAQISAFAALAQDPEARLSAARTALTDMLASFTVTDGVAYALRDGGMQGAYLAGHDMAVQNAAEYGLWFVGTFHATLGLDGFAWEFPANPAGATEDARLGRSGPVHGSKQFVKCANREELLRVLDAVNITT